ncbi:MAG: hypothetical protein ABSF46_06185 [Terriglobia bacterium]|jgi:hypothetical protein
MITAPEGATEVVLEYLPPLRGLLTTLMLYPMAFAMGHNLPPLRGSEGRVDVKLALMGRWPGLC